MQETVARVIEAATDFQKAEVCFKRNDLVQAEHWCRKAIEADTTQYDYHALLAWLVALKPENQSPEKTVESIKILDRAVSKNNRSENAYFWRGLLYKRLGKADLALKDFRQVVEINPRNIDAAREVRLYQMRKSSNPAPSKTGRSSPVPPKAGDPSKSSGILGRLFKKP
jgi:tetratricopeptide (TPR) repeat protein